MKYTISELLENKKLRSAVAEQAYEKALDFEDGNGVTFECPQPNIVLVKGVDKQTVGQVAALVRETRPPEPYHGKGVKYADERIRRKSGKAGK